MIITESHLRESFSEIVVSLSAEMTKTKQFSEANKKDKTVVFLSHKHDESESLKQTVRLLKSCNVDVYIDWMDEEMPKKTCAKTAERLKEKIKDCDRFILIGTEEAINSRWCNWELGQGDIHKYEEYEISILPIKKEYEDYSGNEYIELYPTIQFENGSTKYVFKDNNEGFIFYVPCIEGFKKQIKGYIPKGYYVNIQYNEEGVSMKALIKLEDWLKK